MNEIIDGFEIIETKDVENIEENKDNQTAEDKHEEEDVAIPKRWASLSDNADDSQDETCEALPVSVDALNIPISNNTNDLNTNEKFEPTED